MFNHAATIAVPRLQLKHLSACLLAACLGQPLNSTAQSPTLSDYTVGLSDPLFEAGTPLAIRHQRLHFANNGLIQRDLDVIGPWVVNIAADKTLHVSANVDVNSAPLNSSLYKLGQGTVKLSGHNPFFGGIVVAEGGLSIDTPQAMNNGSAQFVMMPGTRLEFADGLNVRNSILMLSAEQNAIQAVWSHPLSTAPNVNDLTLHIPNGDVYHTGLISIDEEYTLNKTGVGNLHFEGHMGGAGIRGEFHIREGSLVVHNRSTGFITVHKGATLRSRGYVVDLHVKDGARLETYTPTDTFTVWRSLRLSPRSVAHIWLNNNQAKAPLVFEGDVQLNGILMVSLSSDFAQQYPYVVVSAPDGYQGQFAELVYTNPHANMPSLQYKPTEVLLAYADPSTTSPPSILTPPSPPPAPKPKRLNSQAGAYHQVQALQLADSRFLREAATAALWDHTAQHSLGNGVWTRVFHADLHQQPHHSAWGQQRRTEGLFMGADSGYHYLLRYGGQLGLQQSRWHSTRADAQASWTSYTVGASLSSQPNDPLSWHAGMGYTHLQTRHHRTALHTAIHSKQSQPLWQLYAEARPQLLHYQHHTTTQWQQPSTRVYGIGQFIQLYQPAQRSNEHWAQQNTLGLKHKGANATIVGLGLGLQHHYQGEHGNTTVNVRVLRQHTLQGTTLRTHYRHDSATWQDTQFSTRHALNAWQLDLNVRGELAKNSYVGIDLSQRYERKRLDSTLNLNLDINF